MQKSCVHCHHSFDITDDDLAFLETVSPVFAGKKYLIPSPTLCRDCRLQRRVAWRNERVLYQRNCGKCQKSMVSLFSDDKPTPVYCNACWWSDSYEPKDFGQAVDLNRSFCDQLKELMDKVPELTIQNDDGVGSVNCAYCQDFAFGKNCYFVIGTWYTEDSFYSDMNANYNKWVGDCGNISHSELCYECLDSQRLYHCAFVQDSENCSDCFFGFDLKGCRNCFGCIGLRQKEFHIFNQPFTEENYEKEMMKWKLSSFSGLENIKDKYFEWIMKFPRKNVNMQNCENTFGNYNFNCKDSYGFGLINAEGSRYCDQGYGNKFCYDIFNSGNPQWCYEGLVPDNSYESHFNWFTWKDKYVHYSLNCHSSENLFGCVALRRQKYCILNKQYTKEEYEELVPKIIERMKVDQEWGQFFPTKMSYFSYNETVANELFPLTKEAAIMNGFTWKETNPKKYGQQTCLIQDDISDVPDAISKEILACVDCRKNFKVIAAELAFYRKMQIPIPRKCPDCRHHQRLLYRTPYKLWTRMCARCQTPNQTSYAPDRSEIVYCEACYLNTI